MAWDVEIIGRESLSDALLRLGRYRFAARAPGTGECGRVVNGVGGQVPDDLAAAARRWVEAA